MWYLVYGIVSIYHNFASALVIEQNCSRPSPHPAVSCWLQTAAQCSAAARCCVPSPQYGDDGHPDNISITRCTCTLLHCVLDKLDIFIYAVKVQPSPSLSHSTDVFYCQFYTSTTQIVSVCTVFCYM